MSVLGRLAESEAVAIVAVAESMRSNGNAEASTEPLGAGAIVALGPGRYVNRAFVVGSTLSDGDLDRIERYYDARETVPSAQVSASLDAPSLGRLAARGFGLAWTRSLFGAVASDAVSARNAADTSGGRDRNVRIVPVDDDRLAEWLDVLAEGNEVAAGAPRAVSDEHARAAHGAPGSFELLAYDGGHAAACGSVQAAAGVAWLGGAATRPGSRGRGLQLALLRRRVDLAVERGCELVAATSLPSTSSARNIERAGLRLVDTQLVFERRRDAEPPAPA